MPLHPRQHLVDLGDLPRLLGRSSIAQQRIGLVEDEEGAQVRRLLERRRDRLLRLAQPHRAEVGEPPLHDVQVEALGEVAGIGRLARPGRTGEAERERAARATSRPGRRAARGRRRRSSARDRTGSAPPPSAPCACPGLAGRRRGSLARPTRTPRSAPPSGSRSRSAPAAPATARAPAPRSRPSGKSTALAILATIVLRTESVGLGKRSARFMRRTIAGPSRSTSLVIQIVGAAAPSSSRFMKTLLPRRSEPSSSSTPANRSSASSTTTIVLRATPPIALAISSAATRSRRLGSPFASLVSPQNWTEKPTRAPSVLANSLLPVPGAP